MIPRCLLAAPLLLVTSLLTACGGCDVAGEWTLDKAAFRAELQKAMEAGMDDAPDMMKEMKDRVIAGIDAMVASMDLVIVINSDNTFTMTGENPEEKVDDKGEWAMEGERVKFTVEGDQPAYANIDGDVMVLEMPADPDMPAGVPSPKMTFKRK